MACSRPTFYDHICQKYGDVFLALDHDIQKDLQRFVAWARTHPVAMSLLNQKRLPERLGKDILELFFRSHPVHTVSKASLHVLKTHQRLSYAPLISHYMHLKKEHKIDVLIRSAQDISKKSIQRIARAIHSYTGKNADMHLCVDQELWMGMTVMWNHFMIDVSLGKLIHSIRRKDF